MTPKKIPTGTLSERIPDRRTLRSGMGFTVFSGLLDGQVVVGVDTLSLAEVGADAPVAVWVLEDDLDPEAWLDSSDEWIAHCAEIDDEFGRLHRELCPPESSLPDVPELSWSMGGQAIAEAVLDDLDRRGDPSDTYAVLTAYPFADSAEAGAFIQVAGTGGGLMVEVRSVYSHYGFVLPDHIVDRLVRGGFRRPPESRKYGFDGNFETACPKSPVEFGELIDVFVDAHGVQPDAVCDWRRGGDGDFADDPVAEAAMSRAQRSFWRAEVADRLAADREIRELERLAGRGEATLLEILRDAGSFSAFLAAARRGHQDELLSAVTGVVCTPPVDTGELLREVDAMAPVECSVFVLRHLTDSRIDASELENADDYMNIAGERVHSRYLGAGALSVGDSVVQQSDVQVFGLVDVLPLPVPVPAAPLGAPGATSQAMIRADWSAWERDLLAVDRRVEPASVSDVARRAAPNTGVCSSSTVYVQLRAPNGDLALVAHDDRSPWVTASGGFWPELVELRKSVAVSGPGALHKRIRKGESWPGWVATRLTLEEYLVLLIAWSADLERFEPATAAQIVTDIWNGCGPLGRIHDPRDDLLEEFLPPRVEADTTVADLRIPSPSLVPGGFPTWRLSFGSEGLAKVDRVFVEAPGVILSRVIFGSMAGHQTGRWDAPVIEEVQSELDQLDHDCDPIRFLEEIRRIEGVAAKRAADGLIDEMAATEAARLEERQQRRHAPGRGRRLSRVSRFRNWLADQLRRLG